MRANHEEKWVDVNTGRGETEVKLMPGQFIFGRKSAAVRLQLSESTIRNRIVKLQKMGNIHIKPDTHYSIITVLNWDTYQAKEEKEDKQEDTQRTGKGQAKDTDKKDKNDKNEKNKDIYTLPEWFSIEIWKEFLSHRAAIKVPVKKESYQRFIDKFCKWRSEGYEPDKVLDYMIEKGWRSFNPEWIKDNNNGNEKLHTRAINVFLDDMAEKGHFD